MYILGTLTLGAVVLAIYEWRKNKRIVLDDVADPHRDPARAAYTKSDAIRAEANIAHPPQNGGIF